MLVFALITTFTLGCLVNARFILSRVTACNRFKIGLGVNICNS